jgi:uncharacterized membrane protein YbjE (DUF340 family)
MLFLRLVSKDVNTKHQEKIIHFYYFVLYIILISLDLLTTYLGTPDLKLEANPIIQYFALNWTTILILNFVILILLITVTKISDKYIIKYYYSETKCSLSNKTLFVCAILFVILFYCQLITEFFNIINNSLNYIYLHSKHSNILYNVSVNYANLQKQHDPFVSFLTVNLSGYTIGLIVASLRLFYVKKQYER